MTLGKIGARVAELAGVDFLAALNTVALLAFEALKDAIAGRHHPHS